MKASQIFLAARLLGVGRIVRSMVYALRRDWFERRARGPDTQTLHAYHPGRLKSATATDNGAQFEFENQRLEIIFLGSDLVRVHWGAGPARPSYAIAKDDWAIPETELHQTPDGWRLSSPALAVAIASTGRLQFQSPDGPILHTDSPPVFEGLGWRLSTQLPPETRVYGLGERAAPLNLSGGRYQMWNKDPGGSYGPGADPLYLGIPVYLTLHGTGGALVFFDNPFPAEIQVGQPLVASFSGGPLTYYMSPGPLDRALRRYTELTGRPPMPPRWAFGHHQSRWGYQTAEEIRAVARGFTEHDLPLSAVHLDIDYMDEYRVFTVDSDRFPDLGALTKELDALGIQVVTILDPGVKQDRDYPVYREGLRRGAFLQGDPDKPFTGLVWPGWAVYPDFSDPDTRAWWGEQYRELVACGVDGFWHDMNEPTSFAAWGDPTLPKNLPHTMDGRGGTHAEAHNQYGLLMARAGYEGLRSLRPQRRPWLLTRAGWAGVQRYAWNWTGDTDSTWEALRQTIPTVLGLGLSGIGFTGPDIGGFSGAPSSELFLRWFQLAAFLPFFRNHAALGTPPREPWVFDGATRSVLRSFLRLRMRLLPYWYTLAWEAHTSGLPLVRPLFWPDGSDPALWDIDDAFLLGDSLLVAPILQPGASSRRVRLPAGDWFHVWDETVHAGPGLVEVEAPLERIPVFARGGSFIPMHEDDRLTLHLYASQNGEGSGLLYSDDGDGYGSWRLDNFSMAHDGQDVVVRWDQEGEYLFPFERLVLELHGLEAEMVLIGEEETEIVNRRIETGYFDTLRILGPGK